MLLLCAPSQRTVCPHLAFHCARTPVCFTAATCLLPNVQVLFFHRPSRALFVTDLYWNYPASGLPRGSWAWKQGMDRVYLPFYRCFMITDRERFTQQVERVLSWDFTVLVPCHGSVVFEGAKEALREHLLGRKAMGVWAAVDEWKERVMERSG